MRLVAAVLILFLSVTAQAAMSATDCVSFVKASYASRTGKTMGDVPSDLIDICTGIIQMITADAQVQAGIAVSTTGSASAQTGQTTAPGTIK